MRRLLLGTTIVSLALGFPPAAAAQEPTGGGASGPNTGGATFDPRVLEPLRVRSFALNPTTVAPGGSAQVVARVDGPMKRVRLRIDLVADGTRRLVKRVSLGTRSTGRRVTATWAPRGRPLAPGVYTARLHAFGSDGQRLDRAGRTTLRVMAQPPPAPAAPQPAVTAPSAVPASPAGRFPVQGPYSLGGPEARFGAERTGHAHNGQDIVTDEGTPVVSPLAGVVTWRAYQPDGAGNYLVIRAHGRDMAFMHLRDGTSAVSKGEAVQAGQQIAEVGTTGRSSGPHLHFEIWIGGWWEAGGRAIDPVAQLEAWARVGL